jgi:hypothetical protein
MYRRGSDLDVVHANLANLVAAKNKLSSPTPIISVSYLMFAHNEDEFSKFQRQMADLGVDNWYAAPAWLPKGGSINPPKDPRYDMYLLTNDLISKFRSQGGALRPCSWLYYATVINPNGTISPCCGVLSEKSDFGKLDCKEAIVNQFYTDWNGDLYQKARGLFINSDEVKHWAETNLKDLSPDGMALSQKGVSMICAQCPIPHTISIWGEDLKTLFFAFLRETLRCGVSLDYRGFITNIIRTSILCLALCFNAM